MKKLLLALLITVLGLFNYSYASTMNSEINNVISKSGINRSAVSISVKNVRNGKTVYELNPKMPISPASVQKIITATPSFMLLGEDYKFSTKLYKNNSDDYLFVLGADPYLSSKDLDKIVKCIPKEPASISIDSSIIDNNDWGEGWQWDDNLNPSMPKFSSYNLDKNLIEIVISPSLKGAPAEITKSYNYPISFINKIITDKTTNYTIKLQDHISPEVIILDGTVKLDKSIILDIPINNPKKYFDMRLSDAIINHNISSSGEYAEKVLDNNYSLITLLSHDVARAKYDVYKNSNNLVAETVFKLAGGKYSSSVGTFENGLSMFNDFCKKHHLDTSNIKIVDASGVSKNNLMISDFITDFLLNTQGFLEAELPTAGEGTLAKRMLYLSGYVHAKTGTLNNISSIAGYISTRKDNKYVFCIMITDPKSSSADKKMLEEYILRAIYSKG